MVLRPVLPSFRALSGRLKFTVRRHDFNIHRGLEMKELHGTIVFMDFI